MTSKSNIALSVLIAIVLPFVVPPQEISSAHDILIYRTEIASGPIICFIIGYLIYAIHEHRLGIIEHWWLKLLRRN